MHTITLSQRTLNNGNLMVEAHTPFLNEEVDIVIIVNKKGNPPKHDFSDLVGKLEWKGDALQEQKKLRKEWRKK